MKRAKSVWRIILTTLKAMNPDDCEEQEHSVDVDVNVLVKSGNGLPHGRVLIANGAVRKSDIIAFSRENTTSCRQGNSQGNSNSATYQELLRRNTQLELLLGKHVQVLYDKLGIEVPTEIRVIQLQENICGQPSEQVGTQSSHAAESEVAGAPRRVEDDNHIEHEPLLLSY